jgi:uncharacterized membrane protein
MSVMSEMMWTNMAQNLMSWLGLLVGVGGVVLTAAYLKRSRWALLLFGGFLVQTVVRLATQFALPDLATNSRAAFPRVSLFFLVTNALSVAAYAALVVGVGALLSELSRGRVSGRQSSSAQYRGLRS